MGTFVTPEPTSSLEQAILAIDPTTTEVDRFPSVSPATALAMAAVNTTLPAFTVAREPTPSIQSSPSPVLSTGLPLPPAEAPVIGDNLAAPSLTSFSSSHPVASWEGRVEEARIAHFPTNSDLGATVFTSIASPGLHDSLSQSRGADSDMNMSSEFSDAGADLLVCRHLFPHGQSLSTVREDTPAFLGVPPPLSQGSLDRITAWQNSLSFEGESAALDAMYKAVEEIIELRRGYAEFFVDNSLHFLKGSVLEGVTNDDFDSMIVFVSTALSMGPRLQGDLDDGDQFVFLKNSSWYRTAMAMVAAILRGCVRTPDVRERGMYELDEADSFSVATSLRAPATMLEGLQFMVTQLSENLFPDSGALPRASVESIRTHIWETHESALRAELEERAARLRTRLDPNRFASVIDHVLASPSSHALPDAVSSALTEQLTEELRAQLGQRFAAAHNHLDTLGLSDLIDQALEGFSRSEISDTLRDEIRREESSRYNNLLLVARNQAFTEAMDLAVSDGQATADIVCADDRAILADLFRVQAEELEARKVRMTEAHNRRVAALERKLESSHNKLEHSLEEKLALCGSSIDKQRIELANALRAMEEEREREFIRDHAVRLGLLSLHDVDDLRTTKRARNELRSANAEAAARSRSRSVSMASDSRKRGRSPSPPAASKALVEYPSSDPSQGTPEEDDTTPTASPTVPRPHGAMVEQISIHADNPDRTSASSIHAPGSQMDCDVPAKTAEVAPARPAVPHSQPQPQSLSDDSVQALVGIIQTTIRNHCAPIQAQLASLNEAVKAIVQRPTDATLASATGKSSAPHHPAPVKATSTAKGCADVAPAPAGVPGPTERRQTPPRLPTQVDAGRPVPKAQGLSSSAKGEGSASHCLTQQPGPLPLNTPQGTNLGDIQVEAVPPVPSDLTAARGSGAVDEPAWGEKEYPDVGTHDDAFPALEATTPSAKLGKKARAAAKKRMAREQANSSVPGYAPPARDPNGTIPLSRIAPSWLRTTTAASTVQHQRNQGFRTVAAKVQNRGPSGTAKHSASPPSGITEVTVIRNGGITNREEEHAFRRRNPSSIVEAAQRALNARSKFPPTILKGRWSSKVEKNGNLIYTIAGDISPSTLPILSPFLCEPFPGDAVLVPASGWTWAQLRRVPIGDRDTGVTYDNDALYNALVANPCFRDVPLPVSPGWLGNPMNFSNEVASVSFAYVEKDKMITTRAIREGVCMFGHQVQFIHCGDAPTVKQCSRCHSLSHFAGQCKLPEGTVKCARCGDNHEMKDHDHSCSRPHRIPLGCDCPVVCLLCKQPGHHARSRNCPLRKDYVAAIATGTPRARDTAPKPTTVPRTDPGLAQPSARSKKVLHPPKSSVDLPTVRCDDEVAPLGPTLAPGPLTAPLPLAAPRALSESVRQGLAKTAAMMEEAHKEGLLDDTHIFSLSERVCASVAGPSRMTAPRPQDMSDEELDMALEERHLARFSIDHTRDLILARGDLADMADYTRYLQLKDIRRSRFEAAMALDDEQAMRDAAYGPPPSHPSVGVLPLSPPLHVHDITNLGPQGPYPSVSLTAPNTNV